MARTVAGNIEERYLALPRELLSSSAARIISVISSVEDSSPCNCLPLFITVSNADSSDMHVVRAGNERVVRPRTPAMQRYLPGAGSQGLAIFAAAVHWMLSPSEAALGSIGDKVRRIAQLSREIAARIDGEGAQAARAAELAKCDLVSNLVGEFPELQGIMGRYYAAADGEPAEVAAAIAEHYQPRGAGDALPATKSGLAVALADRLDTLTGIFAIGQKPSGTKDPFALRRAAIGVLRMMVEKQLPLDLAALIESSLRAHTVFESPAPQGKSWPAREVVAGEVYDYIMERLRSSYLEADATLPGVTTEAFDAVLATRPRSPLDFDARLRALIGFLALPEAASLTAANKRIANLLKKSAGGDAGNASIDAARLKFDAERLLFTALQGVMHSVPGQVAAGEYAAALAGLAQLRPAVDTFFDEVMVMDPDPALRANRLAMLGTLRELFTGIADLSRLPG